MRNVEYWQWRMVSETTGKRYTTRHKMTESDAMARDPKAERLPMTREVRQLSEPGEYVPSQSSGGPPRVN